MTHNIHHHWYKAPDLRSEFPKPVVRPLQELKNLMFMGEILYHTYSDTPLSPWSSLPDTFDKYQSLIRKFKPIAVKCPDYLTLLRLISIDLNQCSESIPVTWCTGVHFLSSTPPNNYVTEEIILETNGHDSDQSNSFCACLDSDVELKSDDDISYDSCVSMSKVVSKSTLVPIKPCLYIPLKKKLGIGNVSSKDQR